MKINEYTRVPRHEASLILQKNGWKILGAGYFGTVFGKQGRDKVLKLFRAGDEAFTAFVDLARENQSPHFPKFGKLFRIDREYNAVQMEKLTKYDGDESLKMIYRRTEKQEKDMEDVRGWFARHPSIDRACSLLEKLVDEEWFQWDIKSANFMLRGSTLVFTDPICLDVDIDDD